MGAPACEGNTMTGIPTIYNGIRMRSRLEARWAAFFDAVGWQWQYEPVDLEGYVPDFVLAFHRPLLVEVKHWPTPEELEPAMHRIETSGWRHEALVLLGGLPEPGDAHPVCGTLGTPTAHGWEWSEARLFACLSCGSASVLAADYSWHCRVCGEGDGNSHVGAWGRCVEWVEAGNRVQWRPEGECFDRRLPVCLPRGLDRCLYRSRPPYLRPVIGNDTE